MKSGKEDWAGGGSDKKKRWSDEFFRCGDDGRCWRTGGIGGEGKRERKANDSDPFLSFSDAREVGVQRQTAVRGLSICKCVRMKETARRVGHTKGIYELLN